ncbi:hypothetical protein SOVF_104950 isoform A [Spinacia oleracea]|nr:hypothetical protein SOVF_104950 isoform A [Spinacia oleracea]
MKGRELLDNEKEKSMKLFDLPLLSPLLLVGHDQPLSFEVTTTPEGRNLIPRVINTDIMVFMANLDLQPILRSSSSSPRPVQSQQSNELHIAARCGNTNEAREVVRRNKELLRCMDSQGNLPLHLAVANGRKDVASFLFKQYPQGMYALNGLNISPLYLAVHRKDMDFVNKMLKHLRNDDNGLANLRNGRSIVRVAITDKNYGECQGDLLLKYTDSEDGLTPLSYAAFKGYVDIVSYLLKDFPKSISYLNKDKSSPFHKASLGGHVEVLKALYSIPEGRKYLLVVDSRYQTVLHLAAKEGYDIAVKFLLNNCLDLNKGRELLNKKDIHNQTPLSLATTKKVQDFIKSCGFSLSNGIAPCC